MNTFRIALTELRRITAGRLPKVALAALVLVPTLYGGLYLYANHDPYGRLDQVPAALVVEDSGATQADGTRLTAGADVAQELLRKKNFDWHRVRAEQATTGVRDGTYDFALRIPEGFSASLASSGRYDPRQARLEMTTNDANSYLSTTIADKVTVSVRDAIAQKVGVQAATQFLLGLGDVRGGLLKARDGARKLTDGLVRAESGARELRDGGSRLADGASTLATGLQKLASATSDLPSQTARLAAGAAQVADGNAKVASTGDRIAAASRQVDQAVATRRTELTQAMADQGLTAEQQQRLLAVYDRLGATVRDTGGKVRTAAAQLDRLSSGARQVADGNRALAAAVPSLVDGITQARDGSRRLATGAQQLSTGAGDLATGLARLRAGSQQLASGLADGAEKIPALDDETRRRLADTIADPVAVASSSQATASSYGAGLAPFFLALASWIGAYVLFMLVRPLSTRAMAANQNPLRVALGGWLTPALVGLAQVTLLLVVVSGAVGIVPVNAVGAWAFLVLVSATFVAVVHALSAWFGKTGQFLGLVLMVAQLVTAGGTFPWQTIPQPLYVLHHVLPMSYAVDGLRQLMYGGLDARVLDDCLVLVAWLLLGVLASTRAARRQRVWTVKRIKPELAL